MKFRLSLLLFSSRQASEESVKDVSDLIRFLVDHAIRAPSGGNCQPWLFYFDEERLWVVHDRTKSENLLDVGHQASYLALGAAIENIFIAAAYRGYRTSLVPFPRKREPHIVGVLAFEEGLTLVEQETSQLYAQIQKRGTNRQNGPYVPLTTAQIDELYQAAGLHGADLYLLTEKADKEEMGQILAEGDRIRMLCRALHRELMAEIRWTPEEAQSTCDGIDLATLALSPAQEAGLRLLARPQVAALLRRLKGGQAIFSSGTEKLVQTASAIGVLAVSGSAPEDCLRAGRAFERVWLTATPHLALHSIASLIYVFDLPSH